MLSGAPVWERGNILGDVMGRLFARRTAVLATVAIAFAGLAAAPVAASADELLPLTVGNPYTWGSATVGETVRVFTDEDNWTPGTDISVQWYLGDDAISGADGLAYVPDADDMDGYLTVDVTGTLDGYAPETIMLEPGTVQGAWMPMGSVAIVGNTAFGQTLSAQTSGWRDGTELSYEWWRSNSLVGNGATHVVTADDLGQELELYITGSKHGYTESTGWAALRIPNGIVPGAVTISTTLLAASGVVSANVGTWTPGDVSLQYTWLRNGTPIATGGTSSSYLLRYSDEGTTISLRVTGTKNGLSRTTVESNAIAIPLPGAKSPAGSYSAPTITGTAKPGKVLTTRADMSGDGWGFVFVWMRDNSPIPGATGATYTVSNLDAGHYLQVQLVATRPDGYITSKNSESVTVTGGKLEDRGHLHITGKPKVGKKLRAVHGAWGSAKPTTITYQWYANGKKIKKATKSTLKLTKALAGKKITVKTVAKRQYFTTFTSKSSATKVVKK